MIKTCEICGGQYATSLDDVYTEAGCKCSELQRENKRYRKALERIVWQNGLSALQRIAREALRTSKYVITDEGRKAVEKYFRERGHDV